MMKFKSRRQEERQLRMSQLNCFEGGENAFSRKVSAMVVDQKEQLLGQFLTLLSHSKEFSLHREEIHSDDGEVLEDIEASSSLLLDEEETQHDYFEFRKN